MALRKDQRATLTRQQHSAIRRYARARDEERMTKPGGPDRALYGTIGRPTQIPPAVIAERDRRAELRDQQDLTSRFFGDPLPGLSSLDRQRAEAAGRGALRPPRPDGLSPSRTRV